MLVCAEESELSIQWGLSRDKFRSINSMIIMMATLDGSLEYIPFLDMPTASSVGPYLTSILRDGSSPLVVPVSSTMFLAGSCHTYWHFMLVFGILNGISTSLLFVLCFTLIGCWFNVRRGFATCIAALGGAVGGIIYPIIL